MAICQKVHGEGTASLTSAVEGLQWAKAEPLLQGSASRSYCLAVQFKARLIDGGWEPSVRYRAGRCVIDFGRGEVSNF